MKKDHLITGPILEGSTKAHVPKNLDGFPVKNVHYSPLVIESDYVDQSFSVWHVFFEFYIIAV